MGVQFKKQDGQHLLINHGLIDTIIEKSKLSTNDIVLEIGAGTGAITMKLLAKAKKVIAYEKDTKMARELKSKLNHLPDLRRKLVLIEEDVMYQDLPHFDICISNIPFNLSCPILLKLMNHRFNHAYILCQKEFANKLIAKPGTPEYSRLSVVVQLMSKVKHVMKISKNSFFPPPAVDTCFIRIEPRHPRIQIDVPEFSRMLNICFNRKNKTISKNLRCAKMKQELIKQDLLKHDSERQVADENISSPNENLDSVINHVLKEANLVETRTARMSVENFLKLLLEFKKIGVEF